MGIGIIVGGETGEERDGDQLLEERDEAFTGKHVAPFKSDWIEREITNTVRRGSGHWRRNCASYATDLI